MEASDILPQRDGIIFVPLPILPGISMRRGRAEDQASVTRLSKAVDYFSGGDYLPGTWQHLISDPQWSVYVAVKNGEVVCTSCFRSVRGGIQAAGVGGKTHPSVRGDGIFQAMKLYFAACLLAEHPNARCVYGITPFLQLVQDKQGSSPMWNFIDAGRRHQWWMKPTIDHVLAATNRLQNMALPTEPLKSITEDELKSVFQNGILRQKLFPGNHFQMGAEMYEAHEDVTDAVYTGFRQVFMDEERSSLSIHATFPCPAGTAYYIDCYGTADIGAILHHILVGLQKIPEEHNKHGGRVFIMTGFPITANVKELTDIAWNQLGLPREDNKIQEVMLQIFGFNAKL